MSTLPFLLSVADELDNINSQSYMDDFGLGFHPHRQYYRTPTIQLSLPASTDWMQERQRCRTHKFVDESLQSNLQATAEGDDEDNNGDYGGDSGSIENSYGRDYRRYETGASTSSGTRHKYKSALNSNDEFEENIDNSVQMYNLSKKCCKNYYRHAENNPSSASTSANAMISTSTAAIAGTGTGIGVGVGAGAGAGSATAASTAAVNEMVSIGGMATRTVATMEGFKLQTKCMEGNNSSSDESLQKVLSPIEFLTCFLVKKSRTSKSASSSSGGGPGGTGAKKS